MEAAALAGEARLQVVFPGLPRGRHYKVTAQARNALGLSAASAVAEVWLE